MAIEEIVEELCWDEEEEGDEGVMPGGQRFPGFQKLVSLV